MTRRILRALIPALLVVGGLFATSVGSASAEDTVYTCSATGSSAFKVSHQVLVNTETTVAVPDGTILPGGIVANKATLTTGRFVEQLGNESSPPRTITATVNGPNWFSLDQTPSPSGAAASGTSIETGNNVNLFGPASEAALGNSVPVVTFTSGLLLLHVVFPADGSRPYVDHFSLLGGKLVDGCALLST